MFCSKLHYFSFPAIANETCHNCLKWSDRCLPANSKTYLSIDPQEILFWGVGDIEWTIRDTKMYYLSKKCIISPSGPPEATVINRTFVKRRADFLDMPP